LFSVVPALVSLSHRWFVDYLRCKEDWGLILLGKAIHDVPGRIVGICNALSSASISDHIFPKFLLQLLFPYISYFLVY
jgi:hypothetical protein